LITIQETAYTIILNNLTFDLLISLVGADAVQKFYGMTDNLPAAHCTTKMSVTKILREMKQKFSTGITECSCCTWYNTGTGRQFEPRVLLSCEIRTILKDIFKNNPRPTPEEMDKLAEDYHTTIEVVRVS